MSQGSFRQGKFRSALFAVCFTLQFHASNASFSWGVIQSIDAYNSTSAFLVVLLLLVLLEFFLPFLEYMVRDNTLSRAIVKCLTKQLAAFGMTSFFIIGYVASESSTKAKQYLAGLDNAYYLLAFTYIFYFLHILYLLYIARSTRADNYAIHKSTPKLLLADTSMQNAIQKWIFRQAYIPFSNARESCELKILEMLFRDTYALPSGFNFGAYLTKSLQQYALSIFDVSVFQWIIVAVVVELNYARVARNLGFTCNRNDAAYAQKFVDTFSQSSSRRLDISLEPVAASRGAGAFDSHMLDGRRSLQAGGSAGMMECSKFTLHLTFLTAIVLIAYSLLIAIAARFYELRLLYRAHCKEPLDYLKLLRLECLELEVETKTLEEQEAASLTPDTEPAIARNVVSATGLLSKEASESSIVPSVAAQRSSDRVRELRLQQLQQTRSALIDIRNCHAIDGDSATLGSTLLSDDDMFAKVCQLGHILRAMMQQAGQQAAMAIMRASGASDYQYDSVAGGKGADDNSQSDSVFDAPMAPQTPPGGRTSGRVLPEPSSSLTAAATATDLNQPSVSRSRNAAAAALDAQLARRLARLLEEKRSAREDSEADVEQRAGKIPSKGGLEEALSLPAWRRPPPPPTYQSIFTLISDIVLPPFIGVTAKETLQRRERLIQEVTESNVNRYFQRKTAAKRASEALEDEEVPLHYIRPQDIAVQIRTAIKQSLLSGPFYSLAALYRAMDLNGDGVLEGKEVLEYIAKFNELQHLSLDHVHSFIHFVHGSTDDTLVYGQPTLTVDEFRAFMEATEVTTAQSSEGGNEYKPVTHCFREQQAVYWRELPKHMARERAALLIEKKQTKESRLAQKKALRHSALEAAHATEQARIRAKLALEVQPVDPDKEKDKDPAEEGGGPGEEDESKVGLGDGAISVQSASAAEKAQIADIESGMFLDELRSPSDASGGTPSKLSLEFEEDLTPILLPPLKEEKDEIFLFRKSALFYNAVKANIILFCFYLGLWATNMIAIAAEYPIRPDLWQALLIFPMVLVLQVLSSTIKITCRIHAVTSFDLPLVMRCIEDSLEGERLRRTFKDFLSSRVVAMMPPLSGDEDRLECVDVLFEVADDRGPEKATEKLSRKKFARLLRAVNLHHVYTSEERTLLFQAIGRHAEGSGYIEKVDVFRLLFPDYQYSEARLWHKTMHRPPVKAAASDAAVDGHAGSPAQIESIPKTEAATTATTPAPNATKAAAPAPTVALISKPVEPLKKVVAPAPAPVSTKEDSSDDDDDDEEEEEEKIPAPIPAAKPAVKPAAQPAVKPAAQPAVKPAESSSDDDDDDDSDEESSEKDEKPKSAAASKAAAIPVKPAAKDDSDDDDSDENTDEDEDGDDDDDDDEEEE